MDVARGELSVDEGFQGVLKVGFGHQSLLTVLVSTGVEARFAVLAASLGETFSSQDAARVLSHLWRLSVLRMTTSHP